MTDAGWTYGWCVCRLCGHRHMSVWPLAILDEDCQECPKCGHMTAEPENDSEEPSDAAQNSAEGGGEDG